MTDNDVRVRRASIISRLTRGLAACAACATLLALGGPSLQSVTPVGLVVRAFDGAKQMDVVMEDQIGGSIVSVTDGGHYLYAGMGPRVIRVTRDVVPRFLGESPVLDSLVVSVAMSNERVLAATASGTLSILDDSNGMLEIVTDVALPFGVERLAADGSLVFAMTDGPLVVLEWQGYSLITLPWPSAPQGVRAVTEDGDRLYVIAGEELLVYQLPAWPPPLLAQATIAELARTTDMDVVSGTAYIAAGREGLLAIDLADLDQLFATSIYNSFRGIGASFIVRDRWLTLAVSTHGGVYLDVLDVEQPLEPVPIVTMSIAGDVADFIAVPKGFVVATTAEGLQGYLQDADGLLDRTGQYALAGNAVGVDLDGPIVVAADSDYRAGTNRLSVSSVDIFSLGEFGGLETLASFPLPGSAYGVTALGADNAIVADGHTGIWLLDFADETRPFAVSALQTPGMAKSVTVADTRAFVADGSGVRIVDIGDPYHIIERGVAAVPDSHALDVDISNGHVYVADGLHGIVVWRDAGDGTLIWEETFNLPGAGSVMAVGEMLVALRLREQGGGELVTLRHSGMSLELVDRMAVSGTSALAHVGSWILAGHELGVNVVALDESGQMSPEYSFAVAGGAWHIAAGDTHMVVAAGRGGVLTYRLLDGKPEATETPQRRRYRAMVPRAEAP